MLYSDPFWHVCCACKHKNGKEGKREGASFIVVDGREGVMHEEGIPMHIN
jgi:hypothetical protein